MRKSFFVSLVCITMLTACKENHNLVIVTTVIPPADTSYIAGVDGYQAHNVLFEEFTGAKCPNCPAGHKVLDSQVASHAGRINVIALHQAIPGQSQPVAGSAYDLRTDIATNISTTYYGGDPQGTLPNGGADRALFSGHTYIENILSWPSAIGARLSVDSSPVNLYMSSTFDTTKDSATILVTLKYVKTIHQGQNLSIALVEDSLIDQQEDGSNIDTFYVFNSIFRDMITQSNGISGDPILKNSSQILIGTVDARRYTYKVNIGKPTKNNNVLSPKKCRLIAFVTDNVSGVVYQSVQCTLVGP